MKHALYLTLACLSLAGPVLSITVTYDTAGRMASLTYDKLGNMVTITKLATSPPTALVTTGINAPAGKPITYYHIVVDRPAGITGYVVTGLPPGLKVNASITVNADGKTPGTIYGTPTTAGASAIKIAARNAAGIGLSAPLRAVITNPFAMTPDLFGLDGLYSVIFPPSAVTGMEASSPTTRSPALLLGAAMTSPASLRLSKTNSQTFLPP
jgi:hypothetical protein